MLHIYHNVFMPISPASSAWTLFQFLQEKLLEKVGQQCSRGGEGNNGPAVRMEIIELQGYQFC